MLKTAIICLFSLIPLISVSAWTGHEDKTNISIDIGPGNLVRDGKEITYYDFSTKNIHSAEVIFIDERFSGSRLEVRDYETKKRRIFYMDPS